MATRLLSGFERRRKSFVLLFTASVLIVVGAFEAADLWWRRDRTVRAASGRAANLAFVLAEYVRESFEVADASLRQLAVHADRVGGPMAPAGDWAPILAAAHASLPGGGSLSVTNADGVVVHSSQPLIIGQSRRDDYLFKRLSSSARDELVVDRPFLSASAPKRYLIPIGRRLERNGRFAGTVVATLVPQNYGDFFRTVDVGRKGLITIRHPDGVVLFEETPGADGGSPNAAKRTAAGDAVVAERNLINPPIVVSVSLDRGEVLAEWHHQLRVSTGEFGALTLALVALVVLSFRQIDARTRIERELSEIQELEALRLRDANERLALALESEQRARRDAEAASYLKDEFLMTVSHELRTPLTAIYGWVRMLSTSALPAAQQARALESIERNARAQTRLVEDLLDVSRAISGKLRIDARPVNAAEVIGAAIETVGPALHAKSLTLDATLAPEIGTIVADPDRLQQIVWNLLSNAIKFTPDGGRIAVEMARSENQIVIVVSDTGAGIDAEFLPFVFERFRQGESGTRRRYGGLGLGLAIVRHLVELHGGVVSAESAGEGKGATFRVVLPDRVPHAMPELPGQAGLKSPSGDRLDGTRILVVDDEGDARELFCSVLERAGATVWSAPSVAEAMALVETQDLDVLVSDLEMPDEDGFHLLARIRSLPRATSPRLLAIAVTAHARLDDRRRALAAGFQWHLAKPVDPATLVSTIASLTHHEVRQG